MKFTKEYVVTWFDHDLVYEPVSQEFDDFNDALAYFENARKMDIEGADLFVMYYDEDGAPCSSQTLLTYSKEFEPQMEDDVDFDALDKLFDELFLSDNHPDGD